MTKPAPVKRTPDFFGQTLPKGPLYHYTSAEGLLGIVRDKKLWATNIEHLNDTSEFIHGDEFMQRAIAARKALRKTDEELFFEWIESGKAAVDPKNIFVTSLSEDGDSLSQWRGYTPKNGGYSIGFDPAVLREHGWQDHKLILARCVYSEAEKQEVADHILNRSLKSWVANLRPSPSGPSVVPSIASNFGIRAKLAAAIMKHIAFKEEKEWRLFKVCIDDPQIKFHPGVSTIVPYIEHGWSGLKSNPDPIRSVIVGPCPNSELSIKSVDHLLRASGAPKVKAAASKIPFRTW